MEFGVIFQIYVEICNPRKGSWCITAGRQAIAKAMNSQPAVVMDRNPEATKTKISQEL
jgi:hypothetical protein